MEHGIERNNENMHESSNKFYTAAQLPFLTSSSSLLGTDTIVGTTTELRFRNTCIYFNVSYVSSLDKHQDLVCVWPGGELAERNFSQARTSHGFVQHMRQNIQNTTIAQAFIHQNRLNNVEIPTFANAPSGIFPFHRSSTPVIFSPFSSVKILITESMVFSVPRPLTLYLVFKSIVMGFPEDVT